MPPLQGAPAPAVPHRIWQATNAHDADALTAAFAIDVDRYLEPVDGADGDIDTAIGRLTTGSENLR